MKVRTRFAPSPTGTPESIHLGFVIRALWAYAYAKKNGGQFILRIEDTDQKRSRKDTEVEIYKTLKMFGISWDEGPDVGGPFAPYRQSERLDKYKRAAMELIKNGYAYFDFDAETREKEEIKAAYESEEELTKLKERPKAREEDPAKAMERVEKGDKYVVRAKIPESKKFEYTDWILKKKVKFIGKEVPDAILLKSDGFPTYHLAVVVDDIDMEISHVFRGQEWISSTPLHLFVYEGLKTEHPEIGHFSVILDPKTRKKFSKRDMTAMFGVNTWINNGYLPEAVLNYLMLLGWAPKDDREFFTLDEFVQAFDQDGVQKANPIFDAKKLEWMNSQYIMRLSDEEFVKRINEFYKNKDNLSLSDKFDSELVKKITPLIKTRIKTLKEFEGFAGFFFEAPSVDAQLFGENYKEHIKVAKEIIEKSDEWNLEKLNNDLIEAIKLNNFKTGDFFMSLRIAITGQKFTPPVNDSIIILGKDETLSRLNKLL